MVDVLTDHAQQSANGVSEPKPPLERKPDSDDIAQDLEELWKNSMAYFWSNWRRYEAGCWDIRQIGEVHFAARAFLRKYREKGMRVSMSLTREIVSLAETGLLITDRKLIDVGESQRVYINLRNGLYNIYTHQLEPHRPELYFTHQSPFSYDPSATCPTFAEYLKTSLVGEDGKPSREMALLLGEAMAYSMTGLIHMKKSFWVRGVPDSGKSKLMTLIADMNGGFHEAFDLNQLGTNRFMLVKMVGKRVVTFPEANEGSILPDGLYKALVGAGDAIYAEEKNKPGFTFVPQAKVWWAMNNAPRTLDNSGAVANRLCVILFNRAIPPEQQISNLSERLRAEMPGIFNWLMTRLRHLQVNHHFTSPVESERWLQEFKLRNDTYQTFVNEMCIVDPNAKELSRELYSGYKEWAMNNGFVPKNINQVSVEWKRLGFESRQIDGYPYWYGVALKKTQHRF